MSGGVGPDEHVRAPLVVRLAPFRMRVIMQIVLPKFHYELEDEYGLEAFEDSDRSGEFEILGTDDRQFTSPRGR